MKKRSTTTTLAGPSLLKTEPIHLTTILKRGLETKPGQVAMVSNNGNWTWRRLDQASSSVAVAMQKAGIQPGDRVASFMPNCPELLVHYVACLKARVVLTPLNYRYTPPEIDHAIATSQATAFLVHLVGGECQQDLHECNLPESLKIIAFGCGGNVDFTSNNSYSVLANFEDWMEENIETGNNDDDEEEDTDPATNAIIFFTSGSTGKPKGVTHSHHSYGSCLTSMIQAYNINDNDVIMPASSLSHAGGILYSLAGLAAGATVVIAPNAEAMTVLPLVQLTKPTIMFLLPSFLLMLVRDPETQKAAEAFQSLRLLMSAGDKVPSLLQRECHAVTGYYISELYGMSEAAPITGHFEIIESSDLEKLGSIGTAAPGLEISVRDATTKQEVPLGQEGRLWIRGSLVMVGYWNNPKATADTFQDEWMDTGDVVRADKDGHIWFCGRQKQIIVHDGSNISPLEVEDVLLSHPAVAQAGVVGVSDVVHGENVKAYVELKTKVEVSEKELIEHCKKHIGYKSPEVVELLPSLPLNPTGKVDRNALKQKAASEDRRRSSIFDAAASPEFTKLLQSEEFFTLEDSHVE